MIRTANLTLRPWQESDARWLYEYARDARVGNAAGWPAHTSVEESRRIIRDVLSVPNTFAIEDPETHHAIGSISIKPPQNSSISIGFGEGEIGYWLGVPYWNRGLMTEAVRAVIEYGFVTLNLETLWCGHYQENMRSRRVIEKCGFVYHHTEEDKPCPLLNCTHTEHWYSLTRKAWYQNK